MHTLLLTGAQLSGLFYIVFAFHSSLTSTSYIRTFGPRHSAYRSLCVITLLLLLRHPRVRAAACRTPPPKNMRLAHARDLVVSGRSQSLQRRVTRTRRCAMCLGENTRPCRRAPQMPPCLEVARCRPLRQAQGRLQMVSGSTARKAGHHQGGSCRWRRVRHAQDRRCECGTRHARQRR